MLKINYDVTVSETEEAFKTFWKKYNLKRTILLSIVFVIGAGLFINMIAVNVQSVFGWIGSGLALGMLASLWLRPSRARKKLVQALELMDEEKYSATFTAEKIEIETVIVEHKTSENSEEASKEEASDKAETSEEEASEKIENTVIEVATQELYSMEFKEAFLLFVNRSLIYVFPKRCLSEEEIEKLSAYFKENNI